MNTTVEAIASRLVDRYHVEMDIFQVSENCMDALNEMGMLKVSTKAVVGTAANQQFLMPNDCYEVKAVMLLQNVQQWLISTLNISVQDIWFPPAKVFVPVPNAADDPATVLLTDLIVKYLPQFKGPYIDFVWDAPYIGFNTETPPIAAVYKTIPIDKSGLCVIPEQAFNGCLHWCLYVYHQPLFLQGKVAPYIWGELKDWKQKNMAKSMNSYAFSRLNQNEMSKVHAVMASFDRKQTNLDS